MFQLLKKYLKTGSLEKRLLWQTFYWLLVSFFLVRVVPLRWFTGVLGTFRKETDVEINARQEQTIKKARQALRRIKRRLPWKVKCFEEAITIKKVLKSYGTDSTLYLGVKKEGGESLKAHAWLKTGGKVVAGEKGHKTFSIVGFYS